MTMEELIELARNEPDRYEAWMALANKEEVLELVVAWDNDQYMDLTSNELCDLVMEFSREGTKGREEYTLTELLADVRDAVTSDLED